jgi:hypothetical protein
VGNALNAQTANSAGALAAGGLKQSAFKRSVVVTLDFPSIPAQSCDTLDSDIGPGLGAIPAGDSKRLVHPAGGDL